MSRGVIPVMCIAVMTATLSAQSGESMKHDAGMSEPSKMNNMANEATYTGCVQAGKTPGTFVLTGASPMMMHAMPDAAKSAAAMGHEIMASNALMLTGHSSELRKRVGRKVSVTGSIAGAMAGNQSNERTLTVKSIKTVTGACS